MERKSKRRRRRRRMVQGGIDRRKVRKIEKSKGKAWRRENMLGKEEEK